jgi:hypothetical protein
MIPHKHLFGPTGEEVMRGWRQFHNEGIIICTPREYCSGDESMEDEMGGHMIRVGEKRHAY